MKSFTKLLLSAILLLCTITQAKAISDALEFDRKAYANNYLKAHNMTAAQLTKLKAKAESGDIDAQFVYWIIDNYFPQGKKSQESARFLFQPAKKRSRPSAVCGRFNPFDCSALRQTRN